MVLHETRRVGPASSGHRACPCLWISHWDDCRRNPHRILTKHTPIVTKPQYCHALKRSCWLMAHLIHLHLAAAPLSWASRRVREHMCHPAECERHPCATRRLARILSVDGAIKVETMIVACGMCGNTKIDMSCHVAIERGIRVSSCLASAPLRRALTKWRSIPGLPGANSL